MFAPSRPCPKTSTSHGCPWVKSTEPGEFPASRYEALKNTSPDENGEQPQIGDPMFACHKSAETKEYVCAGWLASVGHAHIGVRLNVAFGNWSASVLHPQPDWPELFDNYQDMAAAQAGQEDQ